MRECNGGTKCDGGRQMRQGKWDRCWAMSGEGHGGGRWGEMGCIYVVYHTCQPSAVCIIRQSEYQLMYNGT